MLFMTVGRRAYSPEAKHSREEEFKGRVWERFIYSSYIGGIVLIASAPALVRSGKQGLLMWRQTRKMDVH